MNKFKGQNRKKLPFRRVRKAVRLLKMISISGRKCQERRRSRPCPVIRELEADLPDALHNGEQQQALNGPECQIFADAKGKQGGIGIAARHGEPEGVDNDIAVLNGDIRMGTNKVSLLQQSIEDYELTSL